MDSSSAHPLDDWLPVLPSRELGRRPVECRLFGHEIALYRAADGAAHALDNRCPHRRMRLALGRVVGDRLVCPYHGWHFGPDGTGATPATPGMRVRTGCYAVNEHRGMVWLRTSDGSGQLPALHYEGFEPIGCLHHRLAAPLALLLDNMTELEHTPMVHSIFGFELERLHEVQSDVRRTEDSLEIDYEGPQRRLPFYLRWTTGIERGDRFVQRAVVRHRPLHATYDLEWFAGDLRQRPLALKFVIYFNEVDAHAGTQTTFVFGRASSVLAEAAIRWFGFVLRHHIDRELRADIRLVEQLQLAPGDAHRGMVGRFDRPLVIRRQAESQGEQVVQPPLRSIGRGASREIARQR